MGKCWVNIRVKLVDPEHKKPDRSRGILIAPTISMEELIERFKAIEELINKGYIIQEMVVVSG